MCEAIRASCSVKCNGAANRVKPSDLAAHDWYRFVLSFPPHLVRDYLARFALNSGQTLLDPFCGTGTTVVEARKLGFPSVGLEAHPMAHFATSVKLDWSPDPEELFRLANRAADAALSRLKRGGLSEACLLFPFEPGVVYGSAESQLLRLPEDSEKLLLANSISPIPLHKCLVLLESIQQQIPPVYRRQALLALARTAVDTASNLHFGPEVAAEKHYRLVPPEEFGPEELRLYRSRLAE